MTFGPPPSLPRGEKACHGGSLGFGLALSADPGIWICEGNDVGGVLASGGDGWVLVLASNSFFRRF